MDKTRNSRNTKSRPLPTTNLAARTVEHYRSQLGDRVDEAFGFVHLAAASMAEAVWLVDGEAAPEEVFKLCKKAACAKLKERADRLQSKVLVREAQSQPAH